MSDGREERVELNEREQQKQVDLEDQTEEVVPDDWFPEREDS